MTTAIDDFICPRPERPRPEPQHDFAMDVSNPSLDPARPPHAAPATSGRHRGLRCAGYRPSGSRSMTPRRRSWTCPSASDLALRPGADLWAVHPSHRRPEELSRGTPTSDTFTSKRGFLARSRIDGVQCWSRSVLPCSGRGLRDATSSRSAVPIFRRWARPCAAR
jgi:hypothetical protein